jgi:hypothetical protein
MSACCEESGMPSLRVTQRRTALSPGIRVMALHQDNDLLSRSTRTHDARIAAELARLILPWSKSNVYERIHLDR